MDPAEPAEYPARVARLDPAEYPTRPAPPVDPAEYPAECPCLRRDLENSHIGSMNKTQAPSKKKPDGGLNEVAYSQPKATQKHHPFKHEGTNLFSTPLPPPRSGEILGGTHWRAALAGYSAGAAALAGYWVGA